MLAQLNEKAKSTPNHYIGKDWVTWIQGVFGFQKESMASLITARVNNNIGWKCKVFFIGNCFHTAEVEKIINVYLNLVYSEKIVEYKLPSFSEDYHQEYLQILSEVAGRPIERVTQVMKQLYWATMDGALESDVWLLPITNKLNYDLRKEPENMLNDYGLTYVDDDNESWKTYLKVGGVVAIIGISAYGLSQINRLMGN